MGGFSDWWESMKGTQTERENRFTILLFLSFCFFFGLLGYNWVPEEFSFLVVMPILCFAILGGLGLFEWSEHGPGNTFQRKCRKIKSNGRKCGNEFTQYYPDMYGDRGSYVGFHCSQCRNPRPHDDPFKEFYDEESVNENRVIKSPLMEYTILMSLMLFGGVVLDSLLIIVLIFGILWYRIYQGFD